MTVVDAVVARLQTEEGFRATAYKDTVGHTTIGYGFNVDAGITKPAAAALLRAQVEDLEGQIAALPWWAPLPDNFKLVCLDIAFNAGFHGLLGYPHMIAAMIAGDEAGAAAQCTTSDPRLDASRYAPLRAVILSTPPSCSPRSS